MRRFHNLVVTAVERDTTECVVVSLRPDMSEKDRFAHSPGQHLVLRGPDAIGAPLRSYSLCQAPNQTDLQIAVKRVPHGLFSDWVHNDLRPGVILKASLPSGGFGNDIPAASRYLFVAGGSGISPILSILEHLLAENTNAIATLITANRTPADLQFRERILRLKDQYCERVGLSHLFSRGSHPNRLDAEGAARLIPLLASPHSVDVAFLCGPAGMMSAVARQLESQGVAPNCIRREFFVPPEEQRSMSPILARSIRAPSTALHLDLYGEQYQLALPSGDKTLLDVIIEAGIDIPYSCKTGICGTCRCHLTSGQVDHEDALSLTDREMERGEILLCCARAASARLNLRFDPKF